MLQGKKDSEQDRHLLAGHLASLSALHMFTGVLQGGSECMQEQGEQEPSLQGAVQVLLEISEFRC